MRESVNLERSEWVKFTLCTFTVLRDLSTGRRQTSETKSNNKFSLNAEWRVREQIPATSKFTTIRTLCRAKKAWAMYASWLVLAEYKTADSLSNLSIPMPTDVSRPDWWTLRRENKWMNSHIISEGEYWLFKWSCMKKTDTICLDIPSH